MLSDDLARYVALHHALGFKFQTQQILLRNYVRFAEAEGDQFIITARVLTWAAKAPSSEQKRNRLATVRRFAAAMHAEDPTHEVPAPDAFGRGWFRRKLPHIYTPSEIQRLMKAAVMLHPVGTIRPFTYVMLFGLLAATGMRISEALALRLSDITDDGLIINRTKFKKSRMIPLHPTTRVALDDYLSHRRRLTCFSDALLVTNTGLPVAYDAAAVVFRHLSRRIGLRGNPGEPGPRIHDLRHTFAVRSLEQCSANPDAVSRHMVALSTYLGHAHVTDTYWYLQAAPTLMAQIAEAGETLHVGGVA